MNDTSVSIGVTDRLNSDLRPYKILMDVAGDSFEFAIQPASLKAAATQLVVDLPTGDVDCVVGIAPGGIALAVAVAMEISLPLVVAYKCRVAADEEVCWIEPHSTNATIYCYGIAAGSKVLIVDDEIDTGRTIANGVKAFRDYGISVEGVGCAVEIIHGGVSNGRKVLENMGASLRTLRQFEISEYGA